MNAKQLNEWLLKLKREKLNELDNRFKQMYKERVASLVDDKLGGELSLLQYELSSIKPETIERIFNIINTVNESSSLNLVDEYALRRVANFLRYPEIEMGLDRYSMLSKEIEGHHRMVEIQITGEFDKLFAVLKTKKTMAKKLEWLKSEGLDVPYIETPKPPATIINFSLIKR